MRRALRIPLPFSLVTAWDRKQACLVLVPMIDWGRMRHEFARAATSRSGRRRRKKDGAPAAR